MTKAQIIEHLHQNGEFGANESYTKAQLEKYYGGMKDAQSMSTEELKARVRKGTIK